jgi:hypothetical protein
VQASRGSLIMHWDDDDWAGSQARHHSRRYAISRAQHPPSIKAGRKVCSLVEVMAFRFAVARSVSHSRSNRVELTRPCDLILTRFGGAN